MANEITELFGSVPHGVVVDATLGGAGHAMRLLSTYSWMSVFGIDQDPMAIEHARKVSPQFEGRLMFHQGRFDGIGEFLQLHHVSKISGALFDLGVSSPQFDEADRGFSYRNDGPLDMRMNTTQEFSALDVVNGYEVQQLADVLRENADERFAFRI
ncbi:MAG: S-adenosyl-L-methionine-dependent methyltransferase MraW, partial [Actinomycetota bacterium]